MELRWLGHSCFVLEMDGYKVIFDPFTEGSVPGIPAIHEEVDLVLSSHSHGDHAGAAGVTLRKGKECPFAIEEIHSFHDECRGAKRGKNIIRVLSADGISVAHMGDIGCEPTKEQKEKLKGVDVMLMPVGGFYTLEPKEVKALVEELKPRVLIPMHYRSSSFGFDTIGTLEDYLALCDDVVRYGGPTFTPEKDMPRQTAVLSLT
ncbi:MAG: MBL fold metallo-hydrolase [Blautia sp.]|nr:MBL fold metallo-hydrolase [Blautia sp.]